MNAGGGSRYGNRQYGLWASGAAQLLSQDSPDAHKRAAKDAQQSDMTAATPGTPGHEQRCQVLCGLLKIRISWNLKPGKTFQQQPQKLPLQSREPKEIQGWMSPCEQFTCYRTKRNTAGPRWTTSVTIVAELEPFNLQKHFNRGSPYVPFRHHPI